MPRETPLQSFVNESPIQRSAILAFVRGFAGSLPAGSRVLDVGAGRGPYRSLFMHCQYQTHDWANTVHTSTPPPDVVADLASPLPVGDGSFDAILCTEVLEHVANPGAVLQELGRIASPGARIAITVPFVCPLHEEPYDFVRPTSHGLVSWLQTAGFDDTSVIPLGGWFSMLAQTLRDQALATQQVGRSPGVLPRLVGAGFLLLSDLLRIVAPALDRRLDSRRALPLGWTATAVKPLP